MPAAINWRDCVDNFVVREELNTTDKVVIVVLKGDKENIQD